jgi:predicted nucleotide-binding protein
MAHRSAPPAPPPRPTLTLARSEAARHLKERIDLGKNIQEEFSRAPKLYNPLLPQNPAVASYKRNITQWDEYNVDLLKMLFTTDALAKEYESPVWGVVGCGEVENNPALLATFRENVYSQIATLESIMGRLNLYSEPAKGPAVAPETAPADDKTKVFVVHGHDEGAREAVARFIRDLGFQPIILHERANEGRTVIEKVEAHGAVGFAVVLLTPDDEGCEKGGTPAPRARQNVVLELGYFIGRLGRNRVCALKRGDLEIPSDFGGVVYEPFDVAGAWKQKLGRELKAVGYAIDWNTVMRS